jgi:hypothetical protein
MAEAELFEAIRNRRFNSLERAINAGANINAVEAGDDYTPLTLAIETEDIKYVNRILKANPDINRLAREPLDVETPVSRHLETPLLFALRKNARPPIVKALLKAGADPNIHSRPQDDMFDTKTPLIVAIQNGNKEIIKALLDAGANTNDTTSKGYTPLYAVAFSKGNIKEITSMLLEYGVDQNAKINNKTALEYHKEYYERSKPYNFDEYSDAQQKKMTKNSAYGQHLAAVKPYAQMQEKKQKIINRELDGVQEIASSQKLPQDMSHYISSFVDGNPTKYHYSRTTKKQTSPSRGGRKSRSSRKNKKSTTKSLRR